MALSAGAMSVTLEYAKDLKDKDWLGKQDPYCILSVGGQTFRTRTAKDGGRNPVWNETFKFNLINENDVEVQIKDEDVGRDDLIGTATFSLARARQAGTDRQQVPVVGKKHKQRGFISVSLSWTPNAQPHVGGYHGAAPALPYAAAPYPGGYPMAAAPYPGGYPMAAAPYPGAAPGMTVPAVPACHPGGNTQWPPAAATQWPPAAATQWPPAAATQWPPAAATQWPPAATAYNVPPQSAYPAVPVQPIYR